MKYVCNRIEANYVLEQVFEFFSYNSLLSGKSGTNGSCLGHYFFTILNPTIS